MNTLALMNLPENVLAIGIFAAGFVALIIGWMIHPWTVGGLTRWVESPMQQFFARVGTAVGAAAFTVVGGFHLLDKNGTGSAGSSSSAAAVETTNSSDTSDDPFAEPRTSAPAVARPSAPPVARVEQPASVRPTAQSEAAPESPKTISREITTTRPAPEVVETPREKTSTKPESESIEPSTDSVQLKVAELKGELAALDTKIQAERDRWQEGVNVINRLTNFKRTPVREGSPQYHQCMAASRVIKEVEAGAAGLKAEKARLEAMIQSLENK